LKSEIGQLYWDTIFYKNVTYYGTKGVYACVGINMILGHL